MKFELILAYQNLTSYMKEGTGEEAWNKTMIEPYWNMLTKGAPFPMDHMKPYCNMGVEQAQEQLKLLDEVDWDAYSTRFEEICSKLPKDDEDIMYIVIYPSMTDIPEGIYGTGVWGNILLNINPCNEKALLWIPYVFAHEYHHCVWGDYWFCKQGGVGLNGTFLENLIIEGEADAFAKSLNPFYIPSWHKGVRAEEDLLVWHKFESILEKKLTPKETAAYMFGSEELGIPMNAGYYYAIQIVEAYLKKRESMTFTQMLEVNPNYIYVESQFKKG